MAKRITPKAHLILQFLQSRQGVSSKEIHAGIHEAFSYATIKRLLQELVDCGFVQTVGKGKATRYGLTTSFRLLYPVDLEAYFRNEVDERQINRHFNHEIFQLMQNVSPFTTEETEQLATLQQTYAQRLAGLSASVRSKEMDRLAIDLSWKSSEIEGNTYTLLETERLLQEQKTAEGRTRDEATMVLNHKATLDYILKYPEQFTRLSIAHIEEIHSLLVKDLNVERNIRVRRVGISGTNYRPLENEFQIRESLDEMCKLVNSTADPFAKSLFALVLLSYIQAFVDGNKRTARLVCNAILISHLHCPLSFRTVDAQLYKKAMLVFYEQNNIASVKKFFIEQCAFAVNNYF